MASSPLAPTPAAAGLAATAAGPSRSPSAPATALKNTEDVPLGKKVVFSGLSGAIATTCIYPIDICKTKLQNQKSSATPEFKGPLDCARKLWMREGLKGLYRGWPPNVVLVMPEKALKLTMNDVFRTQLRNMRANKDLPLPLEMLAGGLAGFCQVIATNPMELLKIQGATMAEKIKAGTLQQATPYSVLVRQLGVTGLYTGVLATLSRDVPFSMIYFSLYAQTKDMLLRDTAPGEPLGIKPFLAGAIAGTTAAAVTTPIDVIKTRVHAEAVPARMAFGAWAAREVELLSNTTRTVIAKEGYASLFKGLAPRCLIVSPLFAITMACYEKFQQAFG